MVSQFLKMLKRNLVKNKLQSFLSITCLAIGMASFLIAINYVKFEHTYENFNRNADQVFRLERDIIYESTSYIGWNAVPGVLGPAAKEQIPEVDDYTRVFGNRDPLLIVWGEKKFSEKPGSAHWVDNAFLTMFDCVFIQGNENALKEPYTIVLTESIAKKYFGKEEPIGKSMMMGSDPYIVTGICADPPVNTHFHYKYLLSYSTLVAKSPRWANTSWDGSSFYLYLKVKSGSDLKAWSDKIEPLYPPKPPDYTPSSSYKGSNWYLVPIKNIHLECSENRTTEGHIGGQLEENGNIRIVRFLFILGIFFLLIANINYINMSTSRSMERAKEVGIKKVSGALKSNLIVQFLIENILMNIIAISIAIIILMISPYMLNSILSTHGFSPLEILRENMMIIVILLIVNSIISGLYPALILSSYKPVTVLKGKFSASSRGIKLRKALIVFQFIISIGVIAGVISLKKQLAFMQSKELGFNMEQLLIIETPRSLTRSEYSASLSRFKKELLSDNIINSMSLSTEIPGKGFTFGRGTSLTEIPDVSVSLKLNSVDYSFLEVYDMTLLAGRNFSDDFGTDSRGVIINRKASNHLLFKTPSEAIGKEVDMSGRGPLKIIGVIEDYHHESPNKLMHCVGILLDKNATNYITLKLNSADAVNSLKKISVIWTDIFPNNVFSYYFLDDFFSQQYVASEQLMNLINLFTIILIVLVCLGLWGISSYTISLRTKELAVRRIFYAKSLDVGLLLFNEFYLLILIASIVSLPIAYSVFNTWFDIYAYRISLGWWFFIYPVLLITIITFISIGSGIFKATKIKHVKALKYE